jgi:glycosyltransferase involved in cell wall biosynthesis
MDGLEWKRAKWGPIAKAWFYVNERAGCILGDRLIADNPEIQRHLETRVKVDKITMVPYGADRVTSADVGLVTALGLEPHSFLAVIARPEPENSILEIVRAFSRCKRGVHLAVLGKYDEANPYCRAVKSSASDEVKFLGPIYDKHVVEALRYHSIGYIHGHQVGGTNPSLVEALGAGCPVIAHDNKFNRWVAGPDALYFSEEDTCDAQLTRLLTQPEVAQRMRNSSRDRHLNAFQWFDILESYERLLSGMGWPAGRPQSRGYC